MTQHIHRMPGLSCTLLPALAVWCCLLAPVHADDWRQFRGPNGQGHCDACSLPERWSETENIQWKVPIEGMGHSSPVLLGNQVWLTTALSQGRSLQAICLDAVDGHVVFQTEVFTPEQPVSIDDRNSYATPTPVVEPGRVYVHFGGAGTACLSTESGEVLWRNDELVVDYQSGPANSPILVDDLLIVNFDGGDLQFVAAYDTHTGRVAWKTDRSAPYQDDPILKRAFATPVLITINGQRQLISLGADQMQAYNPTNGSELWQIRYSGTSNIPMVLVNENLIYVCTGFRKPELWAIKPDGQGDISKSHVVWQYKRQVPAVPSPILVDNRIYMVSEKGVMTCLDAEKGRLVWQERLSGNYSASLVYGDGRIYIPSEEGKVTVIAPGDEFRQLAVNELDGFIKATPALADGAIFIRAATHVYRIGTQSP